MSEPTVALTRQVLLELLGDFPQAVALDAETLERTDLGDIVREKVRYQVEPGEWVSAFVFVPLTGSTPLAGCKSRHPLHSTA